MVDGVIDIPLPGRTRESAAEPGGGPVAGHFLAGPENRLVEVVVRAVVERSPDGFNPLVLCGPSGTGKSHLALGLAAAWKARHAASLNGHDVPAPDRQRVVCTSAVDFARELADAIETQDVDEFRAKHRGAAMLVIEDLGQLATRKSGKLSAQEELIHTLDALVAEDRWIIVTASAPPCELPDIVPALQSRLMGGLTIPLALPGCETRLAMLRRLANDRDIRLSEAAAMALAEGFCGTVPELAGLLTQLEAPEGLGCGRLDLATARQYLSGQGRPKEPSLHSIALATARHFSLRLSDLRSPVRQRSLVTARGVAVYLARRLTHDSLQQIGAYFGGRDHTTVLHSCRRTEELMQTEPSIRGSVETLLKTLGKT